MHRIIGFQLSGQRQSRVIASIVFRPKNRRNNITAYFMPCRSIVIVRYQLTFQKKNVDITTTSADFLLIYKQLLLSLWPPTYRQPACWEPRAFKTQSFSPGATINLTPINNPSIPWSTSGTPCWPSEQPTEIPDM